MLDFSSASLAAILADVAKHLEMSKDELTARLFDK